MQTADNTTLQSFKTKKQRRGVRATQNNVLRGATQSDAPCRFEREAMTINVRKQACGLQLPHVVMPAGFSNQRMEHVSFSSGLTMHICELDLRENIHAPFACLGEPFFAIGFYLSGKADFSFGTRKKSKESYNMPKSLFYNFCGTGHAQYYAGEPIRFVSISFAQETLHNILGNDIALLPKLCGKSTGNVESERFLLRDVLTPSMRMTMHQAMRANDDGPCGKLFLESKALELLTLYIQSAADSVRKSSRQGEYIAPADRERLHAAHDILKSELAEPPTIAALSKRVGLNECKLKRLFKCCFKNTIYGFVQYERMRQAKQYIEGGMSVSAAASTLGYVNNSHFAAAFRKHHGVSPGSLKN
jgi:AraC-like DNA-binding protein